MGFSDGVIIVLGLALFEIISSIDNAVVNADVLLTMSERARKWFLFYGIIIAVFVVCGLLPLLIVWASSPGVGFMGALTATFSNDESVRRIIEAQKPILLAGGGLYLVYLFFYWLFIEPKEYAFFFETHIHRKLSFWFYAVASIILLVAVWVGMKINPMIAFGAVVGSTAFFITNGFKHNAEAKERELTHDKRMSDISKILYLEMLDATFSIDGVLGAFAVRYITIHGTKTVKKYRYLKNGAMYSIGSLGLIMLGESLSLHIPMWLPTAITFFVVGLFFWLSKRELEAQHAIAP